mgnify:CR=1 FL=1
MIGWIKAIGLFATLIFVAVILNTLVVMYPVFSGVLFCALISFGIIYTLKVNIFE